MITYQYTLTDFIGNTGVVLLLVSFMLVQLGKLKIESIKYNLANALAAMLLLINLYYKPNLSGIIIEIWWLVFSIYGLIRNYHKY